MRLVYLTIVALCLPALAVAQTAVPTYTLNIYAKGAPTPQVSVALPSVTCGLTVPVDPAATNINAARVIWDDPVTAGKSCVYVDTGSGVLLGRPVGDYDATLTMTTPNGTSPESAPRVPFSVRPRPGAPTGLRFTR